MNEEYIKGRLTVHYCVDIVSLAHKVHGRVSYMDLAEGDHIEVKRGDSYNTVSINDVLNTLVDHGSNRNELWNLGSSIYEGAHVRVMLDEQGNKRAVLTEKSLKINKIMTALKQGIITHEEATQAFLKIELEEDD